MRRKYGDTERALSKIPEVLNARQTIAPPTCFFPSRFGMSYPIEVIPRNAWVVIRQSVFSHLKNKVATFYVQLNTVIHIFACYTYIRQEKRIVPGKIVRSLEYVMLCVLNEHPVAVT